MEFQISALKSGGDTDFPDVLSATTPAQDQSPLRSWQVAGLSGLAEVIPEGVVQRSHSWCHPTWLSLLRVLATLRSLLVWFRALLCCCYLPLFYILYWARLVLRFRSVCGSVGGRAFLLGSFAVPQLDFHAQLLPSPSALLGLFSYLRISYIVSSHGQLHSAVLTQEFLPLRQSPGRFHYGLRTRRGVPPPCTRDPTFQPCILPLRPGLCSLVCLYEVGAEPAA